jgi:hypothetical protein
MVKAGTLVGIALVGGVLILAYYLLGGKISTAASQSAGQSGGGATSNPNLAGATDVLYYAPQYLNQSFQQVQNTTQVTSTNTVKLFSL